MFKRNIDASFVAKSLFNYFTDHICFEQVKNGKSFGKNLRIIDFLAIKKTWSPVTIKAVEIKVDRGDFVSDTKWADYLSLCNQFYFACPAGMIKKSEIDDKVGLIYVGDNGSVKIAKKAIFVANEPSADMLLYLIFWQFGAEDVKEKIRKELAENAEMGKKYGEFVAQKIKEANESTKKAMRELDEHKRYSIHGQQRLDEQLKDVSAISNFIKNRYGTYQGFVDKFGGEERVMAIMERLGQRKDFSQRLEEMKYVIDGFLTELKSVQKKQQ